MTGIFLFSEDPVLAKQLLTPALALKRSLDQPITALALDSAGFEVTIFERVEQLAEFWR